eukprot:5481726-Lingulodinium_polyedra.AAC.1
MGQPCLGRFLPQSVRRSHALATGHGVGCCRRCGAWSAVRVRNSPESLGTRRRCSAPRPEGCARC